VSLDAGRARIHALVRRWTLMRAGGACLAIVASVALGWAFAGRVSAPAALAMSLAVAIGACFWLARGSGAGPVQVARHLDRSAPSLEESAELILADPERLAPLERLQQARIAERLERLARVRIPITPLRRGAAVAVAIAAIALLSLLVPARAARPEHPAAGREIASGLPVLGGIEVTVRPPAYTGLPPRTGTPDLEVESGALVTWQAQANAERVALVRLPADTSWLRRIGARWTVELEAVTPAVYQLIAENAAGRSSGPLHRLGVRPDRPPVLALAHPTGRTTLEPGAARRIDVSAHAWDDYGIAESFLLVTVASGAGEQVKFRERRLPLQATTIDATRSLTLRGTVDLAALGLEPGDEAYLTAVARDGRRPGPQEGRSETAIVALADTSGAEQADFAGLPLLLRPAALRSQRQIILDTERLLRDRRRIGRDEFQSRSAAIGQDQHLLRLRYAELLGGETVEGAELGHEHDTEENATLLSPEVKRGLTAAVDRMWKAEGQLGTFEPRAALPYEYAALERLKEIQRAGRTYVRRTGTEPPALDLSRRLSGELKGAGASTESLTRERRLALPATRAALGELARMREGIEPDGGQGLNTLEAAFREIADRARGGTEEDVEALRSLRSTIDSLRTPASCGGCLASAERRLYALLPRAEPAPGVTPPVGRIGRAYLELLAGQR
jgi:hypothetical protein